MTDEQHNDDHDPEHPSKSQRKRDADAAQKLGEQLVMLDDTRLSKVDLPEQLMDAIMTARKIKQRGGRKRQLQFIGKLMRKIDTTAIETRLNQFDQQHQQQTRAFHAIEQWRDRLIADDQALMELIESYPMLDRQHLRQLIRNARQEQQKNTSTQNTAPRAARNLFRYLRELILETE